MNVIKPQLYCRTVAVGNKTTCLVPGLWKSPMYDIHVPLFWTVIVNIGCLMIYLTPKHLFCLWFFLKSLYDIILQISLWKTFQDCVIGIYRCMLLHWIVHGTCKFGIVPFHCSGLYFKKDFRLSVIHGVSLRLNVRRCLRLNHVVVCFKGAWKWLDRLKFTGHFYFVKEMKMFFALEIFLHWIFFVFT